MNCYSFRLRNNSDLQEVVNSLPTQNTYWLRDELNQKTISKLEGSSPLNEYDWEGRIFSDSYEFRYQRRNEDFKCLYTSLGDEDWPEQQISCKKQNIAFASEEPRAYYVESLKAIVRGESVFKNKHAQILMKEYVFTDNVGGVGYFLCGVR